jgi:acetolactate synthase-1/3 small subunit
MTFVGTRAVRATAMRPVAVTRRVRVKTARPTSRARLVDGFALASAAKPRGRLAVARSSARGDDDDLDRGRTGDGLAPTSYDGTGSTGDVYAGPAKLAGGLRRHTVLVYVADETGMINRVAGVFARRGYNIESLAVGLNIDKAIFTISVICSDPDVEKLIKQVNKLAKVRKVENVTNKECVERGLMLVKVQCEPEQRSQVLEINRIFRASVVDVAEHSLTMSVTGDPGKNRAFQSALMKFGVIQVARTGKLALKREPVYSEARSRRVRLMEAMKKAKDAMSGLNIKEKSAKYQSVLASRIVRAVAGMEHDDDGDLHVGDVYTSLENDDIGVWDVPVLSSSFSGLGHGTDKVDIDKVDDNAKYSPHTISILVDNRPGVLDSITGVFARRGYNIQSLGVGPEKSFDVSRISTVVPGTTEDISMLLKQILKVPYVISAQDITMTPFTERELMLVKVVCPRSQRAEIIDLCGMFRAKVSDISEDTVTIEVSGKQRKINAIQALLEPYGVLEVARSGRVALPRDSGVDSKLLLAIENEQDLWETRD